MNSERNNEIVAFVDRGFDKARVYVKHGVFHILRETADCNAAKDT